MIPSTIKDAPDTRELILATLKSMNLRQKQSYFAKMVAKLIIYIYESGYEVTLGDAWAHTGHKEDSNHYIRLAIDLNLFKDGVYLDLGEEHNQFHDFWDSLGGAERIEEDLNHYSVEHNGRR